MGVVVPAARLGEIRKPVEILSHPVRVSGAAIPSTNRLPQALGSGACHCSRNDQWQSKEWWRRRDCSILFHLVTVAVTFRKR